MIKFTLILIIYQINASRIPTISLELKQIEQQIYDHKRLKPHKPVNQDAQQQFIDGLKNKYRIQSSSQLREATLLNLRQYLYPNNFKLFCIEDDNNVVSIDMQGRVTARWVDINQFGDDVIIGFYDGEGTVTTIKYVCLLEEMFEFHEIDHFDLQNNVTCMIMNQARHFYIYLFGDTKGIITTFYQNGTLRGMTVISRDPITMFARRHPHLIYSSNQLQTSTKYKTAQNYFGFFNSVSMQVTQPICEKTVDRIISIYQDSMFSSQVYVLLENMDVLVYKVKSSKQNECSVSYKIHQKDTKTTTSSKYKMVLMNNYLAIFQSTSMNLNIFNITSFRQRTYEEEQVLMTGLQNNMSEVDQYQLVSAKKGLQSCYVYQVSSNSAGSVLELVFIVFNNHSTKYEITHIVSLNNPLDFSLLDYFRFPVVLVGVVFIFGFQYWSRRQSEDADDDQMKMAKKKIDSMVKQYEQKKQNTKTFSKEQMANNFYDASDEDIPHNKQQ